MNKVIEYGGQKYIYINHDGMEIVEENWLYAYEDGVDKIRTEWVGRAAKDCVGAPEHFLKPYGTLREQIASRGDKDYIVDLYARRLEGDAYADTICRELLKDVLTEEEINGDRWAAHGYYDWIEILIYKLKNK